MNFRKRLQPRQLELQLVPMIDIILFLLTFFILTWNFARWETQMDITVPTAKESTENRRQPGEIIVNVRKDGQILVNQKAMSYDALQNILRNVARQFPGQAVIIRADREVQYQHVIQVLDICRVANIWNVGFATRREGDSQP
ncbi:MAG: biopolymer transporter ExbD [Verrucomicrobiae bacterium]|nr:biopolymer transporter ExbD [Verrucomicrobiae bacterium]